MKTDVTSVAWAFCGIGWVFLLLGEFAVSLAFLFPALILFCVCILMED